MKHFADPDFWAAHKGLRPKIRLLANRCFERLKSDPAHPSLHLKQAGRYWSVRVGLHYRALAIRDGDDFIWSMLQPSGITWRRTHAAKSISWTMMSSENRFPLFGIMVWFWIGSHAEYDRLLR